MSLFFHIVLVLASFDDEADFNAQPKVLLKNIGSATDGNPWSLSEAWDIVKSKSDYYAYVQKYGVEVLGAKTPGQHIRFVGDRPFAVPLSEYLDCRASADVDYEVLMTRLPDIADRAHSLAVLNQLRQLNTDNQLRRPNTETDRAQR